MLPTGPLPLVGAGLAPNKLPFAVGVELVLNEPPSVALNNPGPVVDRPPHTPPIVGAEHVPSMPLSLVGVALAFKK